MHYAMLYETVPDFFERRKPWRKQHLDIVQAAFDRGDLVMAGALADPVDGGLLIFRKDGAAEEFARTDPYVTQGLVRKWTVRKWTTVVGDGATMPVL